MTITAEQREVRKTGLGGSDAAAAVGIDEYRTPLMVWEEKLGLAPPFEGNIATELGQAFEDPICNIYARRTGVELRRVNQTLRHPKYDFMLAHLDRRVVGQKRGVETKLRSSFDRQNWGESGSDQVPHSVLLQVQHYMVVTGLPVFDVPVAFGTDFDVFTVEADKELQESLIEQEHAFWQLVLTKTPPEPKTLEDIKRLYRKGDGPALIAGVDVMTMCTEMLLLKETAKPIEKRLEELELEVKRIMGDAAVLLGPDGRELATWRPSVARRLDQKALQEAHPEVHEAFYLPNVVRRFLLKEPKAPKTKAIKNKGAVDAA